VAATRRVEHQPSGKQVGIDLGLRAFFTDSEGNTVAPPQDLRKAERRLKRLHRRLSKTQKRSRNRRKARQALSKASLKVQRQREDVARKTANALVSSHDVIAYEALQIRHLVKNCHLAKRIADAAWGRFLSWVRYDGTLHRVPVIGMEPAFTTQNCSRCGQRVKKSLRMRTHLCPGCGLLLDRDHNAALNILHKALQGTVEQTRTDEEVSSNASGQPAVRVVALRRLARIQAEGRIPALLAWGVSISIPFKEAIAFDESFDPSRVPVKGSPCEGAEVPWSPDASLRLKEEVIDLLSNLRLPLSLSPLSLHADNKGTLDPFPDKMMYSNAFWKRG
jgi:putative transposase